MEQTASGGFSRVSHSTNYSGDKAIKSLPANFHTPSMFSEVEKAQHVPTEP